MKLRITQYGSVDFRIEHEVDGWFGRKKWKVLTYAVYARMQGKRKQLRTCWDCYRDMTFKTLDRAEFMAEFFANGVREEEEYRRKIEPVSVPLKRPLPIVEKEF